MNRNNESAQQQFAKMTETPVNKLIASLSVPFLLSFMKQLKKETV